MKPLCPKCSRPGVLPFTSIACDFCDPPRGVVRAPTGPKPNGPCKHFSALSATETVRYLAHGHPHLSIIYSSIARADGSLILGKALSGGLSIWSDLKQCALAVTSPLAIDEFGLGAEVLAQAAFSNYKAWVRWDFAAGRVVERVP